MAGAIERVQRIQEVASLHLKGYRNSEIAATLKISPDTVSGDIEEWEGWITDKAEANPDILDDILGNTLKQDEAFAQLEKEAWDVVEEAKIAGVANSRLAALKLALEVSERRAKLRQLLGPRMEKGYIQQVRQTERINQELSRILRDEIADCPRCKTRVWDRLQSLFMGEETQSEVEVLPQLEEHN